MVSRSWIASALVLALASLAACSGKGDPSDPKDPEDPEPDFWLVGDEGSMFALTAGGEASTYPLEDERDLLAIACLGERSAWVVGDEGAVLRTRDAGQSWEAIELGVGEVDWRGLAVAEGTPEGGEALWLVGRAGAVAHTADGGASWALVSGASVDFTGVATKLEGERAVAVAEDGSIWKLAVDGVEMVHAGEAGLSGVARSIHAPRLAAVGAGGLMLRSDDGGASWLEVELPTTRDLHAVQLADHADLIVAVGEAGVVVRVEEGLAEAVEIADAEQGLYGLHLRDDGGGQAVGGGGTLVMTEDAGLSWTTSSMPTTLTLRGVDDFHASHL